MRAAIFIDGGYFLKHIQEHNASVDYTKLANHLLAPVDGGGALDLMRCYFYYCPPYISAEPTEEEKRRMGVHEKFVERVESIDRWQFREGKLEKRREGDRDVYSQKRVDVMLSVDLVRHAAAGHVQHALIIAGDSDFIPAVMAAKEEGVTITLWCAKDKSAHRDLVRLADEVRYFDLKKLPRAANTTRGSRGGSRAKTTKKTKTASKPVEKKSTEKKPAKRRRVVRKKSKST